ncbi:hypothetical protein [Pelagovum pacificum]|uniref:Peptidase S1 n=1 Tax=Pelagovum pacificum TaxID=2588711 RepID=A0A5C5GBK6_9RHOB|nr:hypothetical protein [Pelagovum pacificum]QQA41261.1 hypothetical protein I8N54_10500 [Pelagovum pacificum]TNY31930.1 hypothetical protein FHY64_01095 [Pelagovum pacificum]
MKRLFLAVLAIIGLSATVAAACPSFDTAGVEQYEASGGQLRQPRFFPVTAGGQNNLGGCSHIYSRLGSDQLDYGQSYFTTQPDFSFYLSNMGGVRLVVSVVSECDAALLINTGAVNWYFDDDDNGNLDPRISLTRPSNGRMDIWVGTFDGEYCNAQLRMETFAR